MTKIIRRKYRRSRILGQPLWGARPNDPVVRRNAPPPGMHGASNRSKPSDYGLQLFAKQALKEYYGRITEKQFRLTFKEAERMKGDTGENFIGLLERRLDAVVYRSCIAPTIFAARQLVSHGHIFVDGKKVNIPSYRVKPGQVVEIRKASREIPMVLSSIDSGEREVPDYIELDNSKMMVKYVRVPQLADVPYPIEMKPQMIVEFYSK